MHKNIKNRLNGKNKYTLSTSSIYLSNFESNSCESFAQPLIMFELFSLENAGKSSSLIIGLVSLVSEGTSGMLK